MATETVELTRIQVTPQTVSPPPAIRRKRLRIVELLLVMGIAFAPLLLNSTCAYLLGWQNRFTSLSIAGLVLHECLALAVFAYVLSQQRRRLQDVGFTFRFADVGVGVLLAIGGALAAAFCELALYIVRSVRIDEALQSADAPIVFGPDVVIAGIILIAVNPIFEELLVRGYLMRELTELTRSSWTPVVASVALQSSYHLYQGISNVLFLACCFTVWALYFQRTRKLMPIVFAHFYLDALALFRST